MADVVLCHACRFWVPPLVPKGRWASRHEKTAYGECDAAGHGELLMADGPKGCPECDPYTSRMVLTRSTFGCVLGREQEATNG